jgi:hypothetical protein
MEVKKMRMMNSTLWIPSAGFTAVGAGGGVWGAVTTKIWSLLPVTINLDYNIFFLFLIITGNTNHDFREANASKSVDSVSVFWGAGLQPRSLPLNFFPVVTIHSFVYRTTTISS